MGRVIILDVFLFLVFVACIAGLISLWLFNKRSRLILKKSKTTKVNPIQIGHTHIWGRWQVMTSGYYQVRQCTVCGYTERIRI